MSTECHEWRPLISFYGSVSRSTLTTLQNRRITSSTATRVAFPPACNPNCHHHCPGAKTKPASHPSLHTLGLPTDFINSIPKWFSQLPSPPPQSLGRSSPTGGLACPPTPCTVICSDHVTVLLNLFMCGFQGHTLYPHGPVSLTPSVPVSLSLTLPWGRPAGVQLLKEATLVPTTDLYTTDP